MGFRPTQEHPFLFSPEVQLPSQASSPPQQPKSHQFLPHPGTCSLNLQLGMPGISGKLLCYHFRASDAANWYTIILSFTQHQAGALIIDGLVCLWWSAKLKATTLQDAEDPTWEPANSWAPSAAEQKGKALRTRQGWTLIQQPPWLCGAVSINMDLIVGLYLIIVKWNEIRGRRCWSFGEHLYFQSQRALTSGRGQIDNKCQ